MAAKRIVLEEEEEGLLDDPISLPTQYAVKKNALGRKIGITKLVCAIFAVILLLCMSFGIGFVLGWKLLTEEDMTTKGSSSGQTNDNWGSTVSGNEGISQWIPGKISPGNIRNMLE